MKDIEYKEGAFYGLVSPEDHKELILALIESQAANKERFEDVIQSQGPAIMGKQQHFYIATLSSTLMTPIIELHNLKLQPIAAIV